MVKLMRRSAKIHLFILTTLISLCFFPFTASAHFIRTNIFCRYTSEKPGEIDIDTVVSNTGIATAYNVVVTIFLAGWTEKIDDLPNNTPGGKISFSIRYYNPKLKPGKYTAVIRTTFEELSGRSHRAYHFFEIFYLLNRTAMPDDMGPLVQTDSPLLHRKPFWKRRGHMKLSLTNRHAGPIIVQSTLYLPDGFSAVDPDRLYKLSPEETKRDRISVVADPCAGPTGTYHLVAWYEQGGMHYSSHIQGELRVKDHAVYFGWYLVLAVTALAFLFGVLIHRARAK